MNHAGDGLNFERLASARIMRICQMEFYARALGIRHSAALRELRELYLNMKEVCSASMEVEHNDDICSDICRAVINSIQYPELADSAIRNYIPFWNDRSDICPEETNYNDLVERVIKEISDRFAAEIKMASQRLSIGNFYYLSNFVTENSVERFWCCLSPTKNDQVGGNNGLSIEMASDGILPIDVPVMAGFLNEKYEIYSCSKSDHLSNNDFPTSLCLSVNLGVSQDIFHQAIFDYVMEFTSWQADYIYEELEKNVEFKLDDYLINFERYVDKSLIPRKCSAQKLVSILDGLLCFDYKNSGLKVDDAVEKVICFKRNVLKQVATESGFDVIKKHYGLVCTKINRLVKRME
jgi:hypothetical protein